VMKSISSLGINKIDGDYDYLLSMPIHSLTAEKYAELLKRHSVKTKEREKVEKTSAEDFYRQDLKELRAQVEKSYV